jgi:hypothetical protein
MEYVELPDRPYREVVEDLLERRGIKNRLGMLVWLREQKAIKADANNKRAGKAISEMGILTKMIKEEKEGEGVISGGLPEKKEEQE